MFYKGMMTALITPFIEGKFDDEGFITNIQDQLACGVDGLVVLGTTGESPTLTEEEQELSITLARQTTRRLVPVIAGCGSYCTRTTVQRALKAQRLGADGLILILPYYNRPTQEGLYQHIKTVAEEVELPILLYNHPGRTGVNLLPETLKRLLAFPNIQGIKDCSGSFSQVSDILNLTDRDRFGVLVGDDSLTLPYMAMGAHGVVSVISNLVPDRMLALVRAMQRNDLESARALHYDLLPLFEASGLETNPMPIKEMMRLSGKAAGFCRLPLPEVTLETRQKLEAVLQLTECCR